MATKQSEAAYKKLLEQININYYLTPDEAKSIKSACCATKKAAAKK